MVKKVSIHLDAVITIVLIFLISFGFNLYQRYQFRDLLNEYGEAETKAQDMEVNWKYVKALLAQCKKTENIE